MSSPILAPSLERSVLQLARSGGFAICAADVVNATGCRMTDAHAVLSNLARASRLERVSFGWYSPPGTNKQRPIKHRGAHAVAVGERKSKAAELEGVEVWLSDCPPLPKCPPPLFDAPRARRST